ncbi:putative E3 ubiquitin- ligase HECTD2 [Brachionus plicatilis]|uniref:HECT-type E3 ubiquitin transferase n=1 Tax=Brachionus plicatilis TaxID=10195 RepID=A0A3M7QK29_BRAPC|nr:putative E3 ubiquitin- ligase HECTD2 [Brachionus plicatilis]
MLSKKRFSVDKESQKIMKSSQVVASCRICEMINICDIARILCPYCGSFYDPNVKTEAKLKSRRSSANSTIEKSDSDLSEDDSSQSGGGFRNFIKSFLKITKKSNSNPNLTKNSLQKNKTVSSIANLNQERNFVLEKPEHPFLSVKNKEPNFFKEKAANFQMDSDKFKELASKALEDKNFKDITDFYCWNFSKSSNLISLLVIEKPIKSKQSPDMTYSSPDKKLETIFNFSIDWKFMKDIYLFLQKLSTTETKLIMKAICFCIVNDLKPAIDRLKVHVLRNRSFTKKINIDDQINADNKFQCCEIDRLVIELIYSLVIILCNPLFNLSENSVLFSILLCEIACLNGHLQNILVFNLRRMPLNFFRDILRQIQNFLVSRLFPTSNNRPIRLVNDWLISSVKVIGILYHTNEMQITYYQNHFNEYENDAFLDYRQKKKYFQKLDNQEEYTNPISVVSASTNYSSLFVSYEDFYVKKLDSLNLYKDFVNWQNRGKISKEFCFSQYPYILSINTKRRILEQDSETQMVIIAKQSFMKNARNRNVRVPNSNDLFLTINVRRNNLISDSLNEIEIKKTHLKKKLRVNFLGEVAIDMGGVRKEWFLLVIRQIFSPLYGNY